jgi:hypothetical protein
MLALRYLNNYLKALWHVLYVRACAFKEVPVPLPSYQVTKVGPLAHPQRSQARLMGSKAIRKETPIN